MKPGDVITVEGFDTLPTTADVIYDGVRTLRAVRPFARDVLGRLVWGHEITAERQREFLAARVGTTTMTSRTTG